MTLPSFLIIGAMKAGTTTLYRDLDAHPAVFFPLDKEPGSLLDDHVLSPEGRQDYARLFQRAPSNVVCAEASTTYTMLPRHTGVSERARTVLGSGLRLIYIVRHPIARLVSHHQHSYQLGEIGPDINEEIRRFADLTNFSKYYMQVRPWLSCFDREQCRFVRLESYSANRKVEFHSLTQFLGLPPFAFENSNVIYNAAGSVGRMPRILETFSTCSLYRERIRPHLSSNFRLKVAHAMRRRRKDPVVSMTNDSVAMVHEALREDSLAFSELLGEDVMPESVDTAISRFAKQN